MTDWFRRESWSAEDERDFFARLRRSRGDHNKAQYLRIQAAHLEATGAPPNIVAALGLLDQLVRECPAPAQLATALWQRGRCLQALGEFAKAIASYREALDAERRFPGVRSGAGVDLAWLIATEQMRELYDEAVQRLDAHRPALTFPVDAFRTAAIRALIASDQGDRGRARRYAEIALAAAERSTSGLRHHPALGLVDERYRDAVEQMRRCVAA